MNNSTEKIYGAIYDNDFAKVKDLLFKETGVNGQYDDECWAKLNAACEQYDERYKTWLHFACEPDEDRTEIVQFLLEKGAKSFLKDGKGKTPMDLACGNIVMEQYHMGVISALENKNCCVLFSAIRNGNVDDLNALLAQYDPKHSKQSNVSDNENGETVIKYEGATYVVGAEWYKTFPAYADVVITKADGTVEKSTIYEDEYNELCKKAKAAKAESA